MVLNFILLLCIALSIFILVKQIGKNNPDKFLIPTCEFGISDPVYTIKGRVRIAKYSVFSKHTNRYFKSFPIGFKFFSAQKFVSNIRISYTTPELDEEVIYDNEVEFSSILQEYFYYIPDIIIGKINIEIYTLSKYGKPSIEFEILQGATCHMNREHKISIVFPG
jgi:hypothetical protein